MNDPAPVQQNLLRWMYHALGLQYSILLPLAGVVCFVLALILVSRGKGPMAAAALILIVPMPFLIGLFAAIGGGIAMFTILAMSVTAPKPAEVAEGVSMALVAPYVGLLLMVPAYLVAVVGAFVRSFSSDTTQKMK